MDITTRNVAMSAHFTGALAAFLLPGLGWIGPGLVWLVGRDNRHVARHAREAFRFQLAMAAIAWAIGLLGAGLSCFLFGPVIWLAALVPWLAAVLFGVTAGVATLQGEPFAYPLTGDPADPR